MTLPLPVELPLNIHNDNATYETQFGHVQRPTHKNTTWDIAKVCQILVLVALSAAEPNGKFSSFNSSKFAATKYCFGYHKLNNSQLISLPVVC